MTINLGSPDTIDAHLDESLVVGEPAVVENLTVFPVFGPEPRCSYVSYAEGVVAGVTVRELEAASVNDLLVENPTESKVLLYEGEEVLGAQQNRTLDVPVLVAEQTTLKIPVSCVEAGRWDGSRHREVMAPAPQAANPRLRRVKAEQAAARARAGMDARASQHAVWAEVSQIAADHEVDSATGASHDVFERRRPRLSEFCASIPVHGDQVGSIAAINGEMTVLDFVSRPAAYATLHGRLLQGYALDALGSPGTHRPAELPTARGFALLVADAAIGQRNRGVGIGEEVRFTEEAVSGGGLVCDDELVQLTAFPSSAPADASRVAHGRRIQRPSRRCSGS
jgi:hypothetical protein